MIHILELCIQIAGNLYKSIFPAFNPSIHGEIAPAAWNSAPTAQRAPRQRDDFHLVAITPDGSAAYATNWKPAGERTLEAPVRSGGDMKSGDRCTHITRSDLEELAKRKVSQSTAERIKPLWAKGHSAAEIARAVGMSKRTTEAAIGAFSAALPKTTAIAVAKY